MRPLRRLSATPRGENPMVIKVRAIFGIAVFRLAGRARRRLAAKRAAAPVCCCRPRRAGALVQHGAQPQQYARHPQRSGRRQAYRRADRPFRGRNYHAALWLCLYYCGGCGCALLMKAAQGRFDILLLLAFIPWHLKKAPSWRG